MINILIPMAGEGKAFKEREYTFPKVLVEINGKPMIQVVIENLRFEEEHRFIFIIRKEEDMKYHLGDVLKLIVENSIFIPIDKPTAGAACSAILAIDYIDNENPLIIANADQVIDEDTNTIYKHFKEQDLDGGIITFNSVHPRWSYVRTDQKGFVIEAAEKRPISKHATVGFYYFKKGSDFVISTIDMVKRNAMVNGQFFICPTFNEMVLKSKKIGIYEIDKKSFHSLGTPEDVAEYENLIKSKERVV